MFEECYNEEFYRIDSVRAVIKEADCMVVVGCTLNLIMASCLVHDFAETGKPIICLLYTSPSPRDS